MPPSNEAGNRRTRITRRTPLQVQGHALHETLPLHSAASGGSHLRRCRRTESSASDENTSRPDDTELGQCSGMFPEALGHRCTRRGRCSGTN
jgi:hypothetical protein